MNAELSSDVVSRARVHAALGDPVRLAVVDALMWGDSSPGEVGGRLGLPTNLVAHHLRVLEEAGVVVRARSEGDRRRTYVRLCPAVLAGVAAPEPAAARRVVFVCTRNSARSQLAAAWWARCSRVPATSAGTDPAARVHPRAVRVGRQHGLALADARTAEVSRVLRPGDLVVAVCDSAYEHLGPERAGLHWSVPDPVPADTDAAFEAAFGEIVGRINRFAPVLRSSGRQQ